MKITPNPFWLGIFMLLCAFGLLMYLQSDDLGLGAMFLFIPIPALGFVGLLSTLIGVIMWARDFYRKEPTNLSEIVKPHSDRIYKILALVIAVGSIGFCVVAFLLSPH
jgi:hypothetical protein